MPRPDVQPLSREMSSFGGLLITLSCLSPSIGVFIVASDVIHSAGTGVFACFVAAVILGVAMSAIYAELGSAFPHAGGEYTIVGRIIGPPAGFAMMSINIIGMSVGLALSGLGVADYLKVLAPGLPSIPTAVVLVVVVCLIGVLSVRLNALVTGLFLAAELAALMTVAALGFLHPHRSLIAAITPVMAAPAGGLQTVPLALLGVSAAGAIYAFNGYGSVVLFGEEIKDARKHMGRVVFWALGIAALTELPPVLGVLIGARDLVQLGHSPAPVSAFILEAGGPVLSQVLSLGVALAIFNAMIAIGLVAGRQVYATARDQVWPTPVSHALAKVHSRFGSPWAATLAMGFLGVVFCLTPLKTLVMINANGNVAVYGALAIAAMVGRRKGATTHSRSRIWLYPLAPVAVLIALAAVIWADWLDPDTGRTGLLATLAIIAAGAGYYVLALRRNGRWGHRDPVDDVSPLSTEDA